MARPTPKDNPRRAMFGWLTDKSIEKSATEADLPVEVQSLIAYRNSDSEEALRMNLNTLLRHGVFDVDQLSPTDPADKQERLGQSFYTNYLASRIADESEIRRGKQLPY